MNFKRVFRNAVAAVALAGAALVLMPTEQAHAGIIIRAGFAPPPIPVYEQPLCPGDGFIWTPGYWAWGDGGYYWVDGGWIEPPYVGALWTPGWWGWGDGAYFWHAGYWGRTVGYYGGINYGFGYFGVGFYGGYWNGGHFWYNRAYGHFGEGFHGNFYNRSYAGFSGRPGGSSFNAHPPQEYAGVHGEALNHSSPINGRGSEGFAHTAGFDSHSNVAPALNNGGYNRGSQPNYNGGSYSRGSQPAQSYGGSNRGAPPSYGGRSAAPSYGGGSSHSAAPSVSSGGSHSSSITSHR